jgi:hypothetical protein
MTTLNVRFIQRKRASRTGELLLYCGRDTSERSNKKLYISEEHETNAAHLKNKLGLFC